MSAAASASITGPIGVRLASKRKRAEARTVIADYKAAQAAARDRLRQAQIIPPLKPGQIVRFKGSQTQYQRQADGSLRRVAT